MEDLVIELVGRLVEDLKSVGQWTEALDDVRLAHDLAALLTATHDELNRRATLVIRCQKGSAAYRVFTVAAAGRLLGVVATPIPDGDGWMTFADWITNDPGPTDSRTARCRCCIEAVQLSEQRMLAVITSGRRRESVRRCAIT